MRHRHALHVLLVSALLAGGSVKISSSRDAWQRPDQVMATPDVRPGVQIADLGGGDG